MPESALISLVGSSELTLVTSKVMADTVCQFVSHPDHVRIETHTNAAGVTARFSGPRASPSS